MLGSSASRANQPVQGEGAYGSGRQASVVGRYRRKRTCWQPRCLQAPLASRPVVLRLRLAADLPFSAGAQLGAGRLRAGGNLQEGTARTNLSRKGDRKQSIGRVFARAQAGR